jgi:uncharacterized protein with PIN domain
MKIVLLRFYEELNDYLPEDKKKCDFAVCFDGEVTVARLLFAVGVPVSKVDLILCAGESVSPGYIVRDGDRIGIYPVFESLDVKGIARVREEPLREPRFVVGPGLERLAAYLRMLGFDTRTGTGPEPQAAAVTAEAERRILLTRDCIPGQSSRAFRVRGIRPRRQAAEVLVRLDLYRLITPLSRCPRCNVKLSRAGGLLRCEACGRIDRDGSHLRRMRWLVGHLSRQGGET